MNLKTHYIFSQGMWLHVTFTSRDRVLYKWHFNLLISSIIAHYFWKERADLISLAFFFTAFQRLDGVENFWSKMNFSIVNHACIVVLNKGLILCLFHSCIPNHSDEARMRTSGWDEIVQMCVSLTRKINDHFSMNVDIYTFLNITSSMHLYPRTNTNSDRIYYLI